MQNNKLSDEQLNKLITDTSSLINVTNNLVSMLTTNHNNEATQKQYREQFILNYFMIQNNMTILNDYSIKSIEELKVTYSNLKDKVEKNKLNILSKNEEQFFKKMKEIRKINEANKEIDDMMNKIQGELGVNKEDLKVVRINNTQRGFIQYLIDFIIIIVFNLLCMFALSGFIKWGNWNNIGYLVLFILYYSLIEAISKFILLKFFQVYVIKTMGLLLMIPMILSIAVVMIFPIFVTIESYFYLFMVCIVAYLIRKFITNYILEKVFKNKIVKMPRRDKNG